MKILVTNDDGFKAEGIKILIEFLYQRYFNKNVEIVVVAPFSEMSAVSQKLTLREGLKINLENEIIKGIKMYSVTGTPTDCIKVAIHHLNYFPDLVISGINKGYNTGNDILYSGTISAAFEASLYDIKAIALSCSNKTFEGSKNLDMVFNYLENNNYFDEAMVININIPVNASSIAITNQGKFNFLSKYEKSNDGLYYLRGNHIADDIIEDENTDIYAVCHNQISISFLTSNRTDFLLFNKYRKK